MSEEFLGGYTRRWYDSIKESRRLIYRYNNSCPDRLKERYEILCRLLGRCFEDTLIEPPFHCDDGKNLFVGRHFYANYNLTVLDYEKVTIGDNVLIAPNVTISSAAHDVRRDKRWEDGEMTICGAPVNIGNNVWIGAGAIILPGVTIGDNTVVGAGSVVNRSLPPDCVAAGVPARVIKYLTDK